MATAAELAGLVNFKKTDFYAYKPSFHDNDSKENPTDICQSLSPHRRELIERHEIHEKVQRPFIKSGYLDLTHIPSHTKCVISALFSWHNETTNIYSHLIPATLILCYLCLEWVQIAQYLWNDYGGLCLNPNYYDLYGMILIDDLIYSNWNATSIVLHILISCLLLMCVLSAYYHCGRCADPHLHDYYLTIDWIGVMTLIFSSFFACIYIGFDCYPFVKLIYFIISFGTILFVLIPMFFIWPCETNFKCKAITLALFGAFGAIVIPCHWLLFLATKVEFDIFWSVSVTFFCCYTFGFVCFIFRLPERFMNGKVDMIGNSHNIWHLCIVVGSWLWWKGLTNVVNARQHC